MVYLRNTRGELFRSTQKQKTSSTISEEGFVAASRFYMLATTGWMGGLITNVFKMDDSIGYRDSNEDEERNAREVVSCTTTDHHGR